MASSARRGSIGLDGAESQYCDLSGRGLTAGQVDRTLRVFATADTIDLSNNEIDKIPSSIPTEVVTLDISFNAIASIQGIERLKFVQELHLAFNRLDDVSVLEFCPRLVRVNLSGNRLMNTKGLETLEYLENLDISDNLIELGAESTVAQPNLTHLTIRGNPLSQKPGYHVPMLDMIPSLIILDDKKMRSKANYKTKEASATKSVSYSRIYDDKKQFVIHKQTRPRPATTVQPLLPGDPASNMFKAPNSPSKYRAAPYLSMYDRLAQSNGISSNRPIAPTVKPILDPNPSKPDIAALTRLRGEDQSAAARLQKFVTKPSHEGIGGASTPGHPVASRNIVSNQQPRQQQQRRTTPNVRGSEASVHQSKLTIQHLQPLDTPWTTSRGTS
ncbi:Leucine-rich repeat domain, L domain-like [Phytophthora cactorum]|nr:Leucine-rich repeat domain, L domain-like [Phytophthora cactorum]